MSTRSVRTISRILPSCRHASTSTATSATTQSKAFSIPTSSISSSSTSTSGTSSSSKPTHHLITLKRSAIGLPPSSRSTLEALGLYRLHQSVLQPFSGPTSGKILRVKELVEVKNVTEEVGRKLMIRRRPEGSGVRVNGRVFGGGKST